MSSSGEEEMEELIARAKAFADGLTDAAASDDLVVTGSVRSDEPDAITIAFDGSDAHYLVGRHGQALDALQLIATFAVRPGRGGPRVRITLDADGYRAKRAATLCKMAQELADEVKATGQEAVLDPLSPLERRIVHTALVDDPGVTTYSEGEEPERYIIISPAT